MTSIQEQLNQPIPADAIKVHPFSGRSYIDRHYVVDTLNRIFGPEGWSSNLEECEVLSLQTIKNRRGEEAWQAVCKVRCSLTLVMDQVNHTVRSDYGICENQAATPGECLDTAAKGAATDALKRAASQLGPALGADLYKKEGGQQAQQGARPQPQQRQQATQPQARSGGGEVRGALTAHNQKSGTGARGPWTNNRFQINGQWFGTFDEELAARLIPAVGTGVEVTVELAQGSKGLDLVDVIDAGDLQTQDGGWGEDEVL